jgi:anti-sigma B factor antagonist
VLIGEYLNVPGIQIASGKNAPGSASPDPSDLAPATLGSCSSGTRRRRRPRYRVPSRHRPWVALSAPEPTVIAPEGELDIALVGDFRFALLDAERRGAAAVVVDLSEVSFIDSSGLGALVELHNRLRRRGRRLAVVAPGGSAPAVLLDLAGLRDRLPISETRRAALRHVEQPD